MGRETAAPVLAAVLERVAADVHSGGNGGDQPLGRVLSVRGSQASVGLAETSWHEPDETRATVGRFLGIRTGSRLVIGVVTDASVQTLPIAREQGYNVTAIVDLMGEITEEKDGPRFRRGVTGYPAIGDPAIFITPDDLRVIYDISGGTRSISASCSRTARCRPTSTSMRCFRSTSRCSARRASASPVALP